MTKIMNTENQNIEFKGSWGRGWQKICDGFMAAGLPKSSIESKQGASWLHSKGTT